MTKELVMTHVVKDVSKMVDIESVYVRGEAHFSVWWEMCVVRNDNSLCLYFYGLPLKSPKTWSMEANRNFELISANGNKLVNSKDHSHSEKDGNDRYGDGVFIKWEELMKDYVVDDQVTIQVHLKNLKIGIEKKKLRSFDESRKQFSDVVLIVEDERFYVSKLFLAEQSSYFEALFLRNFSESEQSEITLHDVDSKDFQNFLEVLYGEPAIDDFTVDGILKLSDMYDAQTVTRRCQEFLIKGSEKILEEKLELSTRYRLENLKNNCLLKTNAVDDSE